MTQPIHSCHTNAPSDLVQASQEAIDQPLARSIVRTETLTSSAMSTRISQLQPPITKSSSSALHTSTKARVNPVKERMKVPQPPPRLSLPRINPSSMGHDIQSAKQGKKMASHPQPVPSFETQAHLMSYVKDAKCSLCFMEGAKASHMTDDCPLPDRWIAKGRRIYKDQIRTSIPHRSSSDSHHCFVCRLPFTAKIFHRKEGRGRDACFYPDILNYVAFAIYAYPLYRQYAVDISEGSITHETEWDSLAGWLLDDSHGVINLYRVAEAIYSAVLL
jgi:hypothetical protein